jgi:hypothetical protein
MIIIGTALAVNPFNTCVNAPLDGVPKVLWNLENTVEQCFDFEDIKEFPGRLFMPGKCDDTVWKLVEDLGWTEDFIKTHWRLREMCPFKE